MGQHGLNGLMMWPSAGFLQHMLRTLHARYQFGLIILGRTERTNSIVICGEVFTDFTKPLCGNVIHRPFQILWNLLGEHGYFCSLGIIDAAGVRRKRAVDDGQQCRFSLTVSAEQANALAWLNLHGDPIE